MTCGSGHGWVVGVTTLLFCNFFCQKVKIKCPKSEEFSDFHSKKVGDGVNICDLSVAVAAGAFRFQAEATVAVAPTATAVGRARACAARAAGAAHARHRQLGVRHLLGRVFG